MVYSTKAQLVYDLIKHRIETQEYSQGDSIVISSLAKEVDASPIPVREAMKQLETEGYVKIVPHKGAVVTRFSEEQIAEIIEIRAVLEGLAAKKAIRLITQQDLDTLNELVKKMDLSIEAQDVFEYRKLNREFHTIIYTASKSKRLCDLISQLWDISNWAYKRMRESPEIMKRSNNEHREIINMLINKDETNIEEFIRVHKLKLKK
ncbi:MAG: GntR family transcriptional regulator [Clostridiaceae bacterium]|nr:GntR family transcriptional regulator [Clostridiaceae bacterium]